MCIRDRVDVLEVEEGPSMGGAMLAAVGCGAYPDVETIGKKMAHVVDTVEPEEELVAKYEEQMCIRDRIGTFYNFIEDEGVRLIGCEAAGRGVNTAETAATIATGKLGIFHGMKSYFCQDEYGQIAPVYSISAGLDYPGVGPEHAHLYDIGLAEYVPVTDDEAVYAFEYLAITEGIIPAIEMCIRDRFCDVRHTSVAGNMQVFRKVHGSFRESRWHRG